jgi:hypothetical protein
MEDASALRELIAHSVRMLESRDYSRDQIEGSLEGTEGVEARLIADRTYYVAEAIKGSGESLLVGWMEPAENTLRQRQPGRHGLAHVPGARICRGRGEL